MAYTQPITGSGEDLATLFSRQMTFQQPPPMQQTYQNQPGQPQQIEPEPIIYSISQHYHHSAHVVHHDPPALELQRSSSAPLQSTQPSVEQVLSSHGVDPNGLSPQQLELFKTGDTAQQIRLVELWKIYPPTNSHQPNNQTVAWASTTVEQEELLAQLRHEQLLAERDSQADSTMSLDGTPLTPVQSSDGHWVSTAYVEPYMMSGYDMLARREYEESVKRQLEEELSRPKEVYNDAFGCDYRLATDPVYAATGGAGAGVGWPDQKQPIEHQYGEYQQQQQQQQQQMTAMEF